MDEYISINKIAELKGLKSTHSIRLAINQGKYIAREVEVKGGKSYEILYSSLEPDIQDRLDEEELKTTALVPLENKVNFVSENSRLTALARVDIVVALNNLRKKYPTKKEADSVFLDLYNSGMYLQQAINLTKHILEKRGYEHIPCNLTFRRFAENVKKNNYSKRIIYFQNVNFDEAGFNGIYAKLGIKSVFAKPYNTRAKVIERFFLEFQEEFEKMMTSYIGTSIENKTCLDETSRKIV